MVDTERLLLILGMVACAYIVGSINLSIIVCRLRGINDLRGTGSGNPGATNLLRLAGWQVAVPVLLLDIGKAAGVIWGARFLGLQDLASVLALPLLLGNLFPVFHRFKGGKGVAAAVGVMLAINPVAMLLGGLILLVVVGIGKRVSLGSLSMVAFYPLWLWLDNSTFNDLVIAATIAAVIFITHRANISRLIGGLEPKLGRKKKENR
jgi:glycerol-3-phosphate acyltransferase PlsY